MASRLLLAGFGWKWRRRVLFFWGGYFDSFLLDLYVDLVIMFQGLLLAPNIPQQQQKVDLLFIDYKGEITSYY
jgi:hypothetical protein